MKGLLLIVTLGAGIIFLLMNSSQVWVPSYESQPGAAPPAAWAENARLVGLKISHGKPGPPAASKKDVTPAKTLNLPVTRYEIVVPIPRFPTASELQSARFRSELLKTYGPGDVSAAWLDHGQMNEKFIYTDQTNTAEVVLQDGQVVAAHTN